MNWFTRLFRRSPSALDYDEDLDLSEAQVMVGGSSVEIMHADEFPSFSVSANSIDHRLPRSDGRAQGLALRQAFRPSQPVQNSKQYSGRTHILRRVIRALQDQKMHVVVYGDRGIGKTSLLHVVRELASNANYLVSYTSCGEDSDFYETMRTILGRIPQLYDASIDPTATEAARGGSMADRLPAGPLTMAHISDVMASIEGTRVLILLDEFDRTRSDKFRNSIAELIKNLSDRSIRAQLLIAGVAANLTDLVAHTPSIRRNIIGVAVPNMTAEEVRQMLQRGFEAGKLLIEEDAMDRLVKATGGLPYLAALLGQHAAMVCAEAGEAVVSIAHVQDAIVLAAEDIGSRLSPISRYVIEQHGPLSPESPLAVLAACAVANGGIINDPAVMKHLSELDSSSAGLIVPVSDNPMESWHFREDGVSAYLWLRAASQTF